MYPKTKKKCLFTNKRNKAVKARKVKVIKTYTPNADTWNVVALVLLMATLVWHFKGIIGWLTGATLVDQFGMDPVLSTAIAKCPDILFYATYVGLAVSAVVFCITVFVMHRYICDEMDVCDALHASVVGTLVSVWVFPIAHACIDLAATAMDIRDTSGFDVFQLGIDILPMIVISGVCLVVLSLNKRVYILK